jgi:acetamidase/formamidase
MIHTLTLKNQNLHGSFSNEYQPILTIDSGDSIREKQGYPMVGPIEVKQAKPGMVLEVKLNDIVPGWYGRNWAGGNKSWQNEQLGLTGGDGFNWIGN